MNDSTREAAPPVESEVFLTLFLNIGATRNETSTITANGDPR